jgi:hypothetical protein
MTSMRMYNRQTATFQGTKGMIRLDGGPFNANVNDLAAKSSCTATATG